MVDDLVIGTLVRASSTSPHMQSCAASAQDFERKVGHMNV